MLILYPDNHSQMLLSFGIIANVRVCPSVSSQSGDNSLVDEQRADPELAEIIQYLSNGVLPEEDKQAHELALTKSQYSVVDGVLYQGWYSSNHSYGKPREIIQ